MPAKSRPERALVAWNRTPLDARHQGEFAENRTARRERRAHPSHALPAELAGRLARRATLNHAP
jgi:hypothetical protein